MIASFLAFKVETYTYDADFSLDLHVGRCDVEFVRDPGRAPSRGGGGGSSSKGRGGGAGTGALWGAAP